MPNFSFVTDVGFTANSTNLSYSDLYDFDELPADGATNIFALKYNTEIITSITDARQILVSINGEIQPNFDVNYHYSWGLGLLPVFGAMVGYTITTPGYITFAQAPSRGAQIVIKPLTGRIPSSLRTYPFKALDVMMGP